MNDKCFSLKLCVFCILLCFDIHNTSAGFIIDSIRGDECTHNDNVDGKNTSIVSELGCDSGSEKSLDSDINGLMPCEDSVYYDDDHYLRAQFWLEIPKDKMLSDNFILLMQDVCSEIIQQKASENIYCGLQYKPEEKEVDVSFLSYIKIPHTIIVNNSKICLRRDGFGATMMMEVDKKKLISDYSEIKRYIQEPIQISLNKEDGFVEFVCETNIIGKYDVSSEHEWSEISKIIEESGNRAIIEIVRKAMSAGRTELLDFQRVNKIIYEEKEFKQRLKDYLAE